MISRMRTEYNVGKDLCNEYVHVLFTKNYKKITFAGDTSDTYSEHDKFVDSVIFIYFLLESKSLI